MSTLLERMRSGKPLDSIDIIDVHGHLGRAAFPIPDITVEGLLRVMDRTGVASIICSHMQCLDTDPHAGNAELADMARTGRGRILAYASFWPEDAVVVGDEARRWLDTQGFVGIKLHDVNGFAYTDASYAPALAEADRRRALVLLHTWGKPQEFEQVRRLSADYPEASILLAHAGAAREETYVAIARECANVYLDLTKSLAPMGQLERMAANAGVEKLLFGSDAWFISLTHQVGKVAGSRLTEAEKSAVLGGNARRLLARLTGGPR